MKRHIIFLLALVALAASCTQEIVPQEGGALVEKSFTADLSQTRSHLGTESGGQVPVIWDEDDMIAVYDGYDVQCFTVREGSINGSTAVFCGQVHEDATTFRAAYPYEGAEVEDDQFIIKVPQEQTVGKYSVAPGALMSVTDEIEGGGTFHFHNAVALLQLTVDAGVGKVTIHSASGEAIAGERAKSVTLNTPGTAGTYQVAILPGTYKGIRAFTFKDGKAYVKESENELEARASAIVGLGSVMSATEATLISNAGELKAFLADAANIEKAYLVNDISCAGQQMTCASSFKGVFDGQHHTIAGLGTTLFATNAGTVRNFTLTGSIAVQGTFAPVATTNTGTIAGVTNRMAVSMTTSAAVTQTVLLAGIATTSSGTITGCANHGTITFSSTSTTKAVGVGGIVGYTTGPVTDCVNKGALTLDYQTISGLGTVGSISKGSPSMGGIAAFAYTGGKITGCANHGTITSTASAAKVSSSLSFRCQYGGIAGSAGANITNCQNHGAISVGVLSEDRTAYTAYNYIIGVGGISGGDFNAASQNATNITGCSNDASITAIVDPANSNSTVGGIVGWPGVESTSQTVITSSCTNSGDITVSGAGKVRVGGIHGGSGHLASCTNSGRISYTGTGTAGAVGGVAGFHSQNHKFEKCVNTGDVFCSTAQMVGGILGNAGNVANSILGVGSKVSCNVTSAGTLSSTGMIIGKFNGTSAAITIGTASSPVEVEGSISSAGITIPVHKNNYKDYLCGTANGTSNHVFHAVCYTEAPQSQTYAEGHVTWSDGSAASGITVSDGFNVTVTDSEGHYRLDTRTDTWYIYISYPADAKIGYDSMGRPGFFKRYSSYVTTYDFSMEKQAVEKKFAIFALADPQAHYSARSPQKKADTDRFLAESVPAINAQIAASDIPCYGVTLGDVTYSESSRNSNPGMTIMASHCAQIRMPVFQTMGNHDFTYFYGSGNPITADAGSSTVFLKAQRVFEEAFGPINYSFNRGSVHFVCMRDIIWDSTTDASSYHGGFSDDQLNWLKADLANVPKSKKVILCLHIPLFNITTKDNVTNVLNLISQYTDSEVFSGHTHYKRGATIGSTGMYEHIHSAVCGQWWWSNIEGDGCPNGYTMYRINGTKIADEAFMGVNEGMNKRDNCQIRVYRGGITYGGSKAYFKNSLGSNTLMINVFNHDSRWGAVNVYENGSYAGAATLMSASNAKLTNITSTGQTYTIPAACSQDWWVIGYHIGVVGRGLNSSSTSYQTSNFHMFKYTLKDASASVRVEVTDPYGTVYTTSEVITNGTDYPSYIKAF